MCKILFLSFQLSGQGGVENVLSVFARELNTRGQCVYTALMGPSRRDRQWEVDLPNLEIGPGKGLFQRLRWFHALVRRVKPDLVVVLSPMGAMLAALNRVFSTATYSIASWIHITPEFYESNVDMLRLCDTHLGICPTMTRQLEELTSKPGMTVWNPVKTGRNIVPRSSDGLSLVYIGRLDRIKRVDRILTALEQISGDWKLTVVGDGPERQLLEEMSNNMGLSERVTWKGWLSDPWSNLKEADVGLLSSEYEGFSLSVAEFLCHGIPVVAMDCECGPRDLITPEVNGWLIPLGDVQALSSLLRELIDGWRPIPEPLSIQETVKHLSTDVVVSSFANTIDSILADGNRQLRSMHLADTLSAVCRWSMSQLKHRAAWNSMHTNRW